MAGSLAGPLHPSEVMAHPGRAQIECADRVVLLADDLYAARQDADAWAEASWRRDPGVWQCA